MDKYIAVTCCVLANADKVERSLKLTEVIKDVGALKKSVEHNGVMLNTPSLDIEECCALSALECFRTMVPHLTAREKQFQHKVVRNLRRPLILESVDFCSQKERESTVCQRCDSYPMKDSREFLQQLESLLQKAMNRLV